jgi:hypothetical protein
MFPVKIRDCELSSPLQGLKSVRHLGMNIHVFGCMINLPENLDVLSKGH